MPTFPRGEVGEKEKAEDAEVRRVTCTAAAQGPMTLSNNLSLSDLVLFLLSWSGNRAFASVLIVAIDLCVTLLFFWFFVDANGFAKLHLTVIRSPVDAHR